ncbi:MAG: acetyltransferase [Actinobacteria bacterium]|nr:acetyltransferase [Actinomycetota bacterium]
MTTPTRPEPLVILGAGGHGREVLDLVEAVNGTEPRYRVVGFVDDDPQQPELALARGVPLLDGFDDPRAEGAAFVAGVGSPEGRRALVGRAEAMGLRPVSLRHPTTVSGSVNREGEGLLVFALASYTTNVTFGRHVHVNRTATIGHDCVLGDFCSLHPGAVLSGDVHLGEAVTIGTGATVIQGVRIGAGTFVGAGAAVVRDLPPGVVAVGVPARPLT